MAHQRAFDLDRGEPVPGHVEHVVNPPHDPEVAVGILAGVVTGQILPRHARPIGFLKAFVVTPDTPKHARPRLGHHQPTAFALLDRLSRRIDNLRTHAGQRQRATARLRGRAARQRAHHDAARFGLPPRVDDRASRAANHLVIPDPSLWVDALAHGAEEAEAGKIAPLNVLHSPLHERPDGGRSGVEDRRLLLLDNLPEAAFMRCVWRSLVDEDARTRGQWSVGHVAMTSDPAAIGRAPEEVVITQVKDPLGGRLHPHHVAGCRVLDSLRLSGRSARVEDKQRRLGIHGRRRGVGRHSCHEVVPPHITSRHHVDGLAGAIEHDHMLHARRLLEGLVHVFLEG